jgi:hypothetical protein
MTLMRANDSVAWILAALFASIGLLLSKLYRETGLARRVKKCTE